MPRRRRCATLSEAAARIEALELALEALTIQVAALNQAQEAGAAAQAALAARVRVLESAQPYTLAG